MKTAQNRFIDSLAEGLTIGEAAKRAGVSRQRAYQWRDMSPDLARAWKAAHKPKPLKPKYDPPPKPAYIGKLLRAWTIKHEFTLAQAAGALDMVQASFNNWYYDYSQCHIVKLVHFRLEAPEASPKIMSKDMKLSAWITKHSLEFDKAFVAFTLGIPYRTLHTWLSHGEPDHVKHFLKYRLMFDPKKDSPLVK